MMEFLQHVVNTSLDTVWDVIPILVIVGNPVPPCILDDIAP